MDMALFASPDYLRRAGTPIHPSELSRHNCLVIPVAMPDSVWRFKRGDERVEVPVQGRMQANTVDALRDLVLAGDGITALVDPLVGNNVRNGKLVQVLADWTLQPQLQIHAVFLKNQSAAPKIRLFVDFLAERFAARL